MFRANGLRLPDLSISGFRGIDELHMPRLGRVTLLAGRNSIGKTTVLDAVRVYAAGGRAPAFSKLLRDREELIAWEQEDGERVLVPDLRALFYNRDASRTAHIVIGSRGCNDQLIIKPDASSGMQLDLFDESFEDEHTQTLRVEYGGKPSWFYVRPEPPYHAPVTTRRRDQQKLPEQDEPPSTIECNSLGPGMLGNEDLERLWDSVVLTPDEDRAVAALKLVFGDGVERVAVVGDEATYPRRRGRRAVVLLGGQRRPVPLRSLGDGALRLFGVALALANSRGGFLLIDEAENGIHYSLQRDFWNMVIRMADEYDVQVLATTHSSDCIKGFAKAASEFREAEGLLIRLSRQYGDLRAVEYHEEELAIAAEQGIEVR